MGAQKNRLLRQFSFAHTIFGLEISKIIFNYTHLFKGLYKAVLLFSVCSLSLQINVTLTVIFLILVITLVNVKAPVVATTS